MNNTTWQDETVQALKQGYQSQIDELTVHLENANIAATSLQIQNIKLIKGSESMQTDAVNNTATIKMLMAQLAELKAPIEEIRELKQALTDIRATTVTLGDSQSAWLAWRKCSEIAGKALEKK